MFLAMAFSFLIILNYKPILILNLIPVFIGVTNKLTIDAALNYPKYQMSEFFLGNLAFFHGLITLVPNQWKTNSFIFTITMVYYGYKIWNTFHVWNDEITPSLF